MSKPNRKRDVIYICLYYNDVDFLCELYCIVAWDGPIVYVRSVSYVDLACIAENMAMQNIMVSSAVRLREIVY